MTTKPSKKILIKEENPSADQMSEELSVDDLGKVAGGVVADGGEPARDTAAGISPQAGSRRGSRFLGSSDEGDPI